MAILRMIRTPNIMLRETLSLCLCWSLLLIGTYGQLTDPNEVAALRSIKNSLNDPFRNLASWRKGDPCSSNWTGVICYNTTLDDGYLHVKELMLLNKNFTGTLSPDLGRLSHLKILDFMWNNLTGSIPKEIGNISTLELLLVNGNQLTGPLPYELGNLTNLNRIQIDQNYISGELPSSFANLSNCKHFHMNNNSISGQIPPELSRLPNLVHLLLDNNNLTGYLPPELSQMPSLLIIQLDNNNFSGSTIPSSYGNMSKLLKMSLRNCSLKGPLPNWSGLPSVAYIDLSLNQLEGPIPTGAVSADITTIDLSGNNLNGTLPSSFSNLPLIQKLSVADNRLSGSVPSSIWQNRVLNSTERVILDFENNRFSSISGTLNAAPNITIGFNGNPACINNNSIPFCGPQPEGFADVVNISTLVFCPPNSCPPPYQLAPPSPQVQCFCAAPVFIGYRLKSPGFIDFLPYVALFKNYLSSGLKLTRYQLDIDSVLWQEGPRLLMYLKIFPEYVNDSVRTLNRSQVLGIRSMFSGWLIPDSSVFGPYEFINFTLTSPYDEEFPPSSGSGLSKGAIAGIILGPIAGSATISAIVAILILRRRIRKSSVASKRRASSRTPIKIDGVRNFTFAELAQSTDNFSISTVVGQGGYGKVHRGVLTDGTVVAIKRAQEGSLQGEKEFLTEIELLSRLHHRNLVSLLGYCDEEGEQMLVYEFMPNGTLREHLSGKSSSLALSFAMRVKLALGSARGILYLHTEADPPIFHRDIKSTNILLDSRFTAKVADFGLSRLAPVPALEGDLPSHVSTVVKGTPGYLDPEYFLTHKLTDKSDVYSLGVVFLEMLTGMLPITRGKNIVREVRTSISSGTIFSVMDGRMGHYPMKCAEKFVTLALMCCQEETHERPSMSEVVRELENVWLMMPESDTKITDFSAVSDDVSSATTPPSSSTMVGNLYLSRDISGSDLVSGVVPSIKPR